MSLDVQVAHSVEEVSQSEWDCLVRISRLPSTAGIAFVTLRSRAMCRSMPYNIERVNLLAILLSGSRPVAEKDINIAQYPAVTDLDWAMELHRKVNRCYKAQTGSWMPPTMAHADLAGGSCRASGAGWPSGACIDQDDQSRPTMPRADLALSRTDKRGYNGVLGMRDVWPHPEACFAPKG